MSSPFSIAVVVSRFNTPITSKLLEGAMERLQELDFQSDHITVIHVPGAIEIPFVLQRLARQKKYEALVALGAVIRGETGHYDYVCKQVSDGCQYVTLEYDIPVIFGILTTDNATQAFDRVGGKKGHKGREAIDTAVEMVALARQFG